MVEPTTITDAGLAELERLRAKATEHEPLPWHADTEESNDGSGRISTYAMFDAAGERLFGAENSTVACIEQDDWHRWDDIARNHFAYLEKLVEQHPSLVHRLRTSEARVVELEADVADLSGQLDAVEPAPWPEWTTHILNAVRAQSGYDGYDDATDGVDLPAEVDDLINEFAHETERLQKAVARAEKAEAEVARLREGPAISPLAWLDQSAADFTLFATDTPLGRFVYGTDNRGQPYHQDPHGGEDHATEAEARQAAEAAHAGLVTERLRSLGVTIGAASRADPAPPAQSSAQPPSDGAIYAAVSRKNVSDAAVDEALSSAQPADERVEFERGWAACREAAAAIPHYSKKLQNIVAEIKSLTPPAAGSAAGKGGDEYDRQYLRHGLRPEDLP